MEIARVSKFMVKFPKGSLTRQNHYIREELTKKSKLCIRGWLKKTWHKLIEVGIFY